MRHTVSVVCAPPGDETWRVVVDNKELLAFAGPRAREHAISSGRDIEYFFETDVSELHDTPMEMAPGEPVRRTAVRSR